MRKTTFAFLLLSAFTLLPFATAQSAPARRPMTFDDMMAMKRLGETAVSPDGKWLAYSVTTVDLEQNTKTAELWLQAIAPSSEMRRAIQARSRPARRSVARSLHPRAGGFCSSAAVTAASRSGSRTSIPSTGATSNAKKLTAIATEADNALWSPEGRSIVFTSAVYPDCAAITTADFDTGNKCNADRDARCGRQAR